MLPDLAGWKYKREYFVKIKSIHSRVNVLFTLTMVQVPYIFSANSHETDSSRETLRTSFCAR
jgi:hypothetical protein